MFFLYLILHVYHVLSETNKLVNSEKKLGKICTTRLVLFHLCTDIPGLGWIRIKQTSSEIINGTISLVVHYTY